MTDNTYAYETLHSYHKTSNIDNCEECKELLDKHESTTDAQIDQAIENKYHKHEPRK